MLSREQILTLADLGHEDVHVQEWERTVTVRGLTGRERDELEADSVMAGWVISPVNFRARLLVRVVLDKETREPVFKIKDAEALGNLPVRVLQPLFAAAMKLSGLSSEAVEELGKVTAGPAGASSSTSPSDSE